MGEKVWESPSAGPEKNPLHSKTSHEIASLRHNDETDSNASINPAYLHTDLAALSDEQTRCRLGPSSPLPLLNPAGWLAVAGCPPAAPTAAQPPITNSGPPILPVACCRGPCQCRPASQAGRQQDSVVAVSHTWLKVSDSVVGNRLARLRCHGMQVFCAV